MELLDFILAMAKLCSVAAVGAFVAVAVSNDFRDERKRLTKTGGIAAGGVIIAGLLAVVFSTLETLHAKREQEAVSKRMLTQAAITNQHLYEMRRNAEPIDWTQVHFDMALSFSLDNPELQAFRDRLRKRFEQFQRGADKGGGKLMKSVNEGLEFRRTLRDGVAVDRMTIHEGSAFWPNAAETKEAAANDLLKEWTVEVTFTKDPEAPDDELSFSVRGRLNDRSAIASAAALAPMDDSKAALRAPGPQVLASRLEFDAKRNRLTVFLTCHADPPADPQRTFIGAVDFLGATVALTPLVAHKLTPSLALNEFSASFGPKQSWLRPSAPASESIADGFKTFTFRMTAAR